MNAQQHTMKGFQSALLTRTFALSLVVLGLGQLSLAMSPPASAGSAPAPPRPEGAKAAGCSPASQVTQLAFNNVRAVIENGGNKWQRRGVNRSGYEVPKTPDFTGPNAIYAGGLWMGGVSPDNQLKIAGVLYRTSGRNDFWPGPLTNTGDAAVDADVCLAYDRFWATKRSEAEAHIQWKLCTEDPECNLEEIFPNGYSVPTSFVQWPAMGNVDAGQDLYLAPFVDWDGDGAYDPFQGDYPDFGFETSVEDCKNKLRETPVPLFGDDNIYWIFNDKGDVHTETQGQPIGLEVRGQAFSFNSNDEINNMTFYNYTVINQGTQTLLNTYFGHFIDPDLGCSNDDYAGCDVQRGLGFVYNWQDVDAPCQGAVGYGGPNPPPPAIGVDFFEGPFKDNDLVDNPGPEQGLSCQEYQAQGGIPYKGIGIGYGDGVVDNERFGMRAYLYFNREGNPNMTDPANATHFYNYLRSIWKNNLPMSWGGIGYDDQNPNPVRTFYMYPWSTDPVGWGTNCVPQTDWRETAPTPAQPDRRFAQSAGPFTLEPGAYNNITLGVVYARAAQGGAAASVEVLRVADDKAQALFDNCFKILDGPDAPDLTIRELDRELILYLTNPAGSNNESEQYTELDPIIPEEDVNGNPYDRFYRFQGYKVYQLKDATVSVADLEDPSLARLVYQGDVRDGIGQIVNFEFNQNLNLTVPRELVNGADTGIVHSIRITKDAFAQGDPTLVNFKSYYFLAVSYAYNNYENFAITTNPVTGAQEGTGQAFPYVAGRKAAFGAIRSYVGIPHKPAPQTGGTIQNSQYGDALQVTRLEGQGNGGLQLEIEPASENAIVDGEPWRSDEVTYKRGRGPIDVRVVDPLAVPAAGFELWFQDSVTPGNLNDAYWYIVNLSNSDTVFSDRAIDLKYEQLLLDWGISVSIGQVAYTGSGNEAYTLPLNSGSVTFADPNKAWFTGIPDAEGVSASNWIRSGTFSDADNTDYNDRAGRDDEQVYEGILGGTWAPWALVGQAPFQPSNAQQVSLSQGSVSPIAEAPSIQLVITSDKSKWSRSVVLEQEGTNPSLAVGGVPKLALRSSPSIDKEGRKAGSPGANNDEATLFGAQPTGAGWFPGYAIDLETGERLNIAYGENSFWGGEIGRDMIWNPNDQLTTDSDEPFFGGGHWIYVFKNDRRVAGDAAAPNSEQRVPGYDECRFIHQTIQTTSPEPLRRVFRAVGWVGSAMVAPGRQLLETDVRIVLNQSKPYLIYKDYPGNLYPFTPERNNGLPLYTFKTDGFATQTNVADVAESSLDIINIVPNPYYAFSGYETSRLDNRVKFINLPQTCTITIFNVSGTLVRKFRKDNDLTYLDWDLKNTNNIPIAGGAYICHIEVPGVGEKVIKWFGAMRPLDLQNF
jgi:hypothetical protein